MRESPSFGSVFPPGPAGADVRTGPAPLGRALKDLTRCVWRTFDLVLRGRIHQPDANVGRAIAFGDGTTATVYRETVIERPPPADPAVLAVCFRLRRIESARLHALFRVESLLNTAFFAGFPGLLSKLWLSHDQNRVYRGLYQWDDPKLALSYARTLWWLLALVSDKESIRYQVLPDVGLDQLLSGRALTDGANMTHSWWLPVVP